MPICLVGIVSLQEWDVLHREVSRNPRSWKTRHWQALLSHSTRASRAGQVPWQKGQPTVQGWPGKPAVMRHDTQAHGQCWLKSSGQDWWALVCLQHSLCKVQGQQPEVKHGSGAIIWASSRSFQQPHPCCIHRRGHQEPGRRRSGCRAQWCTQVPGSNSAWVRGALWSQSEHLQPSHLHQEPVQKGCYIKLSPCQHQTFK